MCCLICSVPCLPIITYYWRTSVRFYVLCSAPFLDERGLCSVPLGGSVWRKSSYIVRVSAENTHGASCTALVNNCFLPIQNHWLGQELWPENQCLKTHDEVIRHNGDPTKKPFDPGDGKNPEAHVEMWLFKSGHTLLSWKSSVFSMCK